MRGGTEFKVLVKPTLVQASESPLRQTASLTTSPTDGLSVRLIS